MQIDGINIHAPGELSEISNDIGIYAWYGRVSIGLADCAEEAVFTEVVAKHSKRMTQSQMNVNVRSSFGRSWRGDIPVKRIQGVGDVANGDGQANAAIPGTIEARRLLAEMFNSSIPIMASPLYIGIAVEQSLRERISQHLAGFDTCVDAIRRGLEIQSEDKFAKRAAKGGFKRDHLRIITMPLKTDGSTTFTEAHQKDAIKSFEYLVNRWYCPTLGER